MKTQHIPALTAEQMRKVDQLTVEKYGIQLIQMMENAGRNLAELTRRWLGGSVQGRHVIVATGKGNNGGGGMVAARHLHHWGARVTVLLESERFSGTPRLQWEILKRLPLERKLAQAALELLAKCRGDVLIDALIGYGLSGPPRGWVARAIVAINALGIPVIALDVPSGLDATTGKIHQPCIRATATLSLALPKTGLMKPEAKDAIGRLYLADIGVPNVVYREMGIEVGPVFTHNAIISLAGQQEGAGREACPWRTPTS